MGEAKRSAVVADRLGKQRERNRNLQRLLDRITSDNEIMFRALDDIARHCPDHPDYPRNEGMSYEALAARALRAFNQLEVSRGEV